MAINLWNNVKKFHSILFGNLFVLAALCLRRLQRLFNAYFYFDKRDFISALLCNYVYFFVVNFLLLDRSMGSVVKNYIVL